ncbi:hypothetical protein [Alcanivorax sp.]|jgi:hypothetical protein|uniref:hypothetical protein n=1 Tax=Alcanivorax sp. TaxID=1872427 RepID=UPI0032D91CCE
MRKALSVVLGASLGISPLWAGAAESDVEQTLRDYQQRLEALEQQQLDSELKEPDKLRINGFLSAGMSRAEADTSLGENGTYIDGSGDTWSHDSLTRAGVQFNARLTDKAEAVVQLFASGADDFNAEVQWAYLDYDVTDSVSVKAGRIVAPFYLHSQYVDVGYAYPWVSLPSEVYQLAPIKTMEAVEASWAFNTGSVSHRLGGFWGSSTVDGGSRVGNAQYQADDLSGINLTSRWRDWTVRGAYSAAAVSVGQDDLSALGLPASLSFDEVYTYFAGLGLQYDDGSWFMSAEVARLDFGNWYPSSQSAYVSLGKYMGKWMPLLTWAEVDPRDLDSGPINDSLAEQQKSWTAGLRYSLTDSIALKGEFSYYYDFSDDEVSTTGFFVTEPGAEIENDHATIVRLSADLVF